MRKVIASVLIALFSTLLPSISFASAPVAGEKCKKVGTTQTYINKKFTCIKSGKNLIWNKGTVIATTRQMAPSRPQSSFVPQVLQPNDPQKLSSNSPAPGRFCVDEAGQAAFGNEYLACNKGVWTRQLGFRITPTKKTAQTYSPKFGKLTEMEIEKNILKNWAAWKKKKLSNTAKAIVVLQDGYSKDWENVTREVITYTNNVLDGNGLKLVQVPYWVFGETEDFRVKAFGDFAKNASCNPPYMANSEEAIYCATMDIGSGGLRISKPGVPVANDYRLTQKDIGLLTYFVAHDMGIFYVVQAQYGDVAYTGNKYQIPAWIREGTAQLIGLMVANDLRNGGKSYTDLSGHDAFVGPKPSSICSKDLQDAEGKEKIMPDMCSQAQHLYAVSLLAAKYGGLEALFKFHKLYGQNDDWVNDFKQCFGISREDFYREWWAYLGIAPSDWPEIQQPTGPQRY
jgi:hypothetical protein